MSSVNLAVSIRKCKRLIEKAVMRYILYTKMRKMSRLFDPALHNNFFFFF